MSDQSPPTVDPYDFLRIVPNSDGSITRLPIFPLISAAPDPDPDHPSSVLTKDIPLSQSDGTWLRIFLPPQALDPSSKLPLVVYYHGGGFILLSAASSINHNLCSILAAEIPAIIVSVGYRLAPEHRLPAAYDDCVDALHWIKTTQDDWLTKFADLSNLYIMGSSAGGNIAYHAGLRLSSISAVDDLKPLKIRGLILHQPFFGGTRRTASELRLAHNIQLPLGACDVMWELGLPCGVDRDHEYCNPTVGGGSPLCDRIRLLGWKVMVTGCDGDPLIDRQVEVAEMLEEKGVEVVRAFGEGGHHGVEFGGPTEAVALCSAVKKFILS